MSSSNTSDFKQLTLIIWIILFILGIYSPITSTSDDDWELSLDDNEKLALEAIKCLHRQLDDDKDGNINLDESNEYLREELKYERGFENRQKVFHRNNDNQVTVRELWDTWVKSEVHNWTIEQTVEWLSVFVGLPQYKTIFIQNSFNGSVLPRLAVNHQQFLSSGLGVKDMIHKQKISLKAQDVVLFGPPKEHTTYIKDMILTSLLVIAIGIGWNVYVRYKSSQRELIKIIKDMEGLAKAEKELQDLQNIMEKNKMEREELSKQIEKSMSSKSYSDLELPEDQVREEISHLRSEVEKMLVDSKGSCEFLAEVGSREVGGVSDSYHSSITTTTPPCCQERQNQILVLRSELQRAEVELQDKCWVPPIALQHWLQLTYELELKTYNRKKQSAEKQLRQAKDACDKLKRKRSSLMGAFVSTHGKSIDDVDKAILEAKSALTEITHELQERMHRWKQIEGLANCPIMNNPGLHYLEALLRTCGKMYSYGSGPGSVMSNSQDDIDDDGTSSIYCPSAVSIPTSSSGVQQMPRSRSVGNMMNLRSNTIGSGRELLSREYSSTMEEDNVGGDGLEMVTGKDRRVTFGMRPESRLAGIGFMERKHNSLQLTSHLSKLSEQNSDEAELKDEKPDLIQMSNRSSPFGLEECSSRFMKIIPNNTNTNNNNNNNTNNNNNNMGSPQISMNVPKYDNNCKTKMLSRSISRLVSDKSLKTKKCLKLNGSDERNSNVTSSHDKKMKSNLFSSFRRKGRVDVSQQLSQF